MTRPFDLVFGLLIAVGFFAGPIFKNISICKLANHSLALFAGFALAMMPHFLVSKLLYGKFLWIFQAEAIGPESVHHLIAWNWQSPNFFKILFSSMHGLFSWTPILLLCVLGLLLFIRKDKILGASFLLSFFLSVYLLGCTHALWDQGSSFGGRYFVSYTPVFVLGLCGTVNFLKRYISKTTLMTIALLFIVWNLFFIIQFGLGIVPRWDYISWPEMIHSQFFIVPQFLIRKFLALLEKNFIILYGSFVFVIVSVILIWIKRRQLYLFYQEL